MLNHLGNDLRKLKFSNFRKERGVWNYKRKGLTKRHSKPGLIDVKLK
jgi:hypothetical protein